MEIDIRGHRFFILPEKALFWAENQILILGDVHLGKITHFRKEGIPLPGAATEKNFEVLDRLAERWNPKKILFLGDLFHSSPNREWIDFSNWRSKYPSVEMHVVLGNHDRHLPGFYPLDMNINLHADEWTVDKFRFTHEPPEESDLFTFCAHIHPVIALKAYKQKLRLPCLYLNDKVALLPGFGYFTGGFEIMRKSPEDRIFAFTGESVAEI